MTLAEIAKAIQEHGFETRIKGDTLVVYHGIVRLDSFSILEVFCESCFVESEEDGIRYEIDRKDGKFEMELLVGVLNDRREMADDGQIVISIEEIDWEE